jgi:pilus assembly protein CpaF
MSMYAESLRHYLKPVAEYLDDPKVSEIMINGPEDVWIERAGRLTKTEAKFTTEGIEAAARNMAQYVGRMLNDERPRLDARLPDGSRIHVVMPPIARKGCTIAIRKFFPDKLTVQNLVEFGSMTPAMARFIHACVGVKENIIVSGGTGSGKTTLLNCVAQFIEDDERILTIEDSAELQLNQEHLVPFESRPADKFGKGEVNMGDLLHSALRLRPDRIVVGEVRGGEAFHLMQAMNTGHGGSLATAHANTPTDTLRRLESLCLQSGVELPMVAVRAQVASAINVVISCARLQDGSRKTTHVSEVLPLDDKGDYRTQDIFVFTQTHKDADGKIHGYHAPTGLLPTFFDRLGAYGFADCDEAFFDPATYDVEPPPVFAASEGYKAKWAPSLRHRQEGRPDPVRPKRPKGGGDGSGSGGGGAGPSAATGAAAKPAAEKPVAEARAEAAPAVKAAPDVEPAEAAAPPPAPKADPAPARKAAPPEPEPEAAPAPETPEVDDALGEAVPDDAGDEEESTDPGLAAPVVAETAEPSDNVDVSLDEADPTAAVILPDTGPEDADELISNEVLDDEMAAIEAALAAEAEGAAPKADEPSIQLADDFAEEAKKHDDELSGVRPRPQPRPRTPPAGGRRRRGGVIGRSGEPE